MPSWLVVAIAVATPLFAFLGAVIGHWWSRKAARELDHWRRREETMRLLRWAVEMATDTDENKSASGLVILDALLDSELLQSEDVELVGNIATGIALNTIGPGSDDAAAAKTPAGSLAPPDRPQP